MNDVEEDFNIWEGVYDDFEDVRGTGDGFDGDQWINQIRTELANLRDRLDSSSVVPAEPWYSFSQLPLLTAQLQQQHDNVQILDFGGGICQTYERLRACLEDTTDVSFYVVERGPVHESAKEAFKQDSTVKFHKSLPSRPKKFHIVHIGSTLQYIDDWKGLLDNLCTFEPEWLYLTDLMAGDIPTFVTKQNYYESTIPARFYNFEEIRETLKNQGYSLQYRSQSRRQILDELQPLPMGNLPPENQLDFAMNALFTRTG